MRTFDKFFILEKGEYPNIDNMKDDNKDALNGYLEDDTKKEIENKIIKAAQLVIKKDLNKNGELKDFCKDKNFYVGDEFGRKISFILNIFSKNDELEKFDELIKSENKGFFTFDDLKKGNDIFDILEKKCGIKNQKLAEEIFNTTIKDDDEKGADIGRGEVLLQTLMITGHKVSSGDVGYDKDKVMEVKGNSSKPSGQNKVDNIKVFYQEFFEAFNDLTKDKPYKFQNFKRYYVGSDEWFQKETADDYMEVFKQFLAETEIEIGNQKYTGKQAFFKLMCDAVAFQYNKGTSYFGDLYDNNKTTIDNLLSETNSVNLQKNMIHLLGCIQLHQYQKGSTGENHFNAFIIFGINKKNGKYFIVDFDKQNVFENFATILDNIQFGAIGKSNSDRAKAAKMCLKGDSFSKKINDTVLVKTNGAVELFLLRHFYVFFNFN